MLRPRQGACERYSQVASWLSKRNFIWIQQQNRRGTRCVTTMLSAKKHVYSLTGIKWKSLRLDLLEVDRMTALIHYERQRWKKVNFFAKKPLPRSLFQHVRNAVHAQFHWLAYTRNTRPCDVVCLQSKHFRSIAGILLAPRADLRARSIAIDREVKHETLPANRTRLLVAPVDLLPVLAVDLLACSRRRHCSPADSWRSSTGHDRSQCTTTKDRSRKKAVMVALWSFLLDCLDVERSILRFPSALHASEVALRILAKGNWKIDSFLWGGRFGRSLLCPGRAEKKTRGSCPPTGCLPVDRNKPGPDSWRDEKGVWYRTHRHTHTRN